MMVDSTYGEPEGAGRGILRKTGPRRAAPVQTYPMQPDSPRDAPGGARNSIRIGRAGWSLPGMHKPHFPEEGSHLARYAEVFNGVEINSSFYRHHRERTYARWAESVPEHFRFAVKVSKEITHETRLRLPPLLDEFLAGPLRLGEKLGPLLVQLPPSLGLELSTADAFFSELRARFEGSVVCEPRHPSWFAEVADELLTRYKVSRVAADPAPAPGAGAPAGDPSVTYVRLHGSPRMYYSSYDEAALAAWAEYLLACRGAIWCIFDNTARQAAIPNALRLMEILRASGGSPG